MHALHRLPQQNATVEVSVVPHGDGGAPDLDLVNFSLPTTNDGVLRRGAATDLMEQVGDALFAAPRSAYVLVQRST